MQNYQQFCTLSDRYVQIAEQAAKAQPSDAKKKPKLSKEHVRARRKPPSS
jgi:hypothetical protein